MAAASSSSPDVPLDAEWSEGVFRVDSRGLLQLCVPYHRVWWKWYPAFQKKEAWRRRHAMEERLYPVRLDALEGPRPLTLDGNRAIIPSRLKSLRTARLGVDVFLLSDAAEL